jgi:hypothetical protein
MTRCRADHEAVGQPAPLDLGDQRAERFILQWGKVECGADAVLGEHEADGAVTQTTASIVEDDLRNRGTGGPNPCGIEGEEVKDDHSESKVGKGDEPQQGQVHREYRQPNQGPEASEQR